MTVPSPFTGDLRPLETSHHFRLRQSRIHKARLMIIDRTHTSTTEMIRAGRRRCDRCHTAT